MGCILPKTQGDPVFDVLLQSPDPTCAVVAAATTSINADRKASIQQDPCIGAVGGAAAAAADADAGRELTALPASDLSHLQPFELDESIEGGNDTDGSGKYQAVTAAAEGVEVSLLAETLKNRGNDLFKLGDTGAAEEWFCRVLRTLEQPPVVGRW